MDARYTERRLRSDKVCVGSFEVPTIYSNKNSVASVRTGGGWVGGSQGIKYMTGEHTTCLQRCFFSKRGKSERKAESSESTIKLT